MPLLRGGANFNSRKKGTRVKAIRQGKYIGGGFEGKVHRVTAVIRRRGRERVLPMVEKKFKSRPKLVSRVTKPGDKNQTTRMVLSNYPLIRNPKKQIELIQQLPHLNRTNHLGIRLPRTIRLRTYPWYQFMRARLVMSEIPHLTTVEKLTDEEFHEFFEDRRKQMVTLSTKGFEAGKDAFEPQLNPKTKKMRGLFS